MPSEMPETVEVNGKSTMTQRDKSNELDQNYNQKSILEATEGCRQLSLA